MIKIEVGILYDGTKSALCWHSFMHWKSFRIFVVDYLYMKWSWWWERALRRKNSKNDDAIIECISLLGCFFLSVILKKRGEISKARAPASAGCWHVNNRRARRSKDRGRARALGFRFKVAAEKWRMEEGSFCSVHLFLLCFRSAIIVLHLHFTTCTHSTITKFYFLQ